MGKMTEAAREALKAINEAADDWVAYCPKCKAKLTGKLSELRCGCTR